MMLLHLKFLFLILSPVICHIKLGGCITMCKERLNLPLKQIITFICLCICPFFMKLRKSLTYGIMNTLGFSILEAVNSLKQLHKECKIFIICSDNANCVIDLFVKLLSHLRYLSFFFPLEWQWHKSVVVLALN